jgi:hypothetical protein
VSPLFPSFFSLLDPFPSQVILRSSTLFRIHLEKSDA